MSSVVISGDTSGAITLTAPAVAGTYTQTLPQITGTLGTLNSGTKVDSTSGTSIDFTSIPANVRRITVMLQGVSTNGTSPIILQLGTGGVPTTSGYVGATMSAANGATPGVLTYSSGIRSIGGTTIAATQITSAVFVAFNINANSWCVNVNLGESTTPYGAVGSGYVSLAGVLNFVRITTVGGTDTFDAGSINILYE